MCPLDLQTYGADAVTWFWNGQGKGERIWMVSGWRVQMPQIEKLGNLMRKRSYDEETLTLIVKDRPCLLTWRKRAVAQTGWWKQWRPHALQFR